MKIKHFLLTTLLKLVLFLLVVCVLFLGFIFGMDKADASHATSTMTLTTTPSATPTATPDPVHGLAVEYFNNLHLTGDPSAVQIDPKVDLRLVWGQSPAAGIASDFSARWTGFVVPPETDTYVFWVAADDGVRFWFDNNLLVDDWDTPTLQHHTTDVMQLVGGQKYPIKLEMYDNRGSATMLLAWQKGPFVGSNAYDPIPEVQLLPPDGPLPQVSTTPRAANELCVPDLTSPDNQYFAGTPLPPTSVFAGSVDELKQITLVPNDFIGGMPTGVYRVLIVPVGYAQSEMGEFASRLGDLRIVLAQLRLNAHIAYVGRPLPVPVDMYGSDVLEISDEAVNQVHDMVEATGQPLPHVIIFDVNHWGRANAGGTDKGVYRIVVDNEEDSYLYARVHELAHAWGLSDGYLDSFYDYGGLMDSTEIFLSDAQGSPLIANQDWNDWIIARGGVGFSLTDMTCLGEHIWKMDGETDSLMDSYWSTNYILVDGKVDPQVFTPFQLWLMQENIKKIIQKQP